MAKQKARINLHIFLCRADTTQACVDILFVSGELGCQIRPGGLHAGKKSALYGHYYMSIVSLHTIH